MKQFEITAEEVSRNVYTVRARDKDEAFNKLSDLDFESKIHVPDTGYINCEDVDTNRDIKEVHNEKHRADGPDSVGEVTP